MPSKKQSVHLEDTLHKRIKSKAVNEGSTIEKIVHTILNKELKKEEKIERETRR